MPYFLDRFEYKCPKGHLNKIDKTYSANGNGDPAIESNVKLSDTLPCSGCQYELIPVSPVRVVHCDLTEMNFFKTKEDKYAESTAYHEAGHVVIAAVQRVPLSNRGLRIDQKGAGISYYRFAKPDGSANLGSEIKREQTIRSIQAGYIAQEKFYLRFYDQLAPSGSSTDTDGINALLEEMYTGRNACENAKAVLGKQSQQLVEDNWQAIEALAQTLLAKQWESQALPSGERRWATQTCQKKMTGPEVVDLLYEFKITATLEPDPTP